MRIEPLAAEPGHFLFGFHDVCAWDPSGERVAALRAERIDRPPVADDRVLVGFLTEATGAFTALRETSGYNFPVGNRQLWDPRGGGLWVNHREGDRWRASLMALDGRPVVELEIALWAIDPEKPWGYGVNFARIQRLGGYGFVGCPDRTVASRTDGLWRVDLGSGAAELLVPLADLAHAAEVSAHYVTHVVPSPTGARIAFLHRYWLPDGGQHTRLLTVNRDGTDLRLQLEGFVSHFDWSDEGGLVVWARRGRLDVARAHPLLAVPGVAPLARLARRGLRPLLRRVRAPVAGATGFFRVDVATGRLEPFLPDLLSGDGHPAFCPADRRLLVVDSYPDEAGMRDLLLIDHTRQVVLERASLLEPRGLVDRSRLAEGQVGIDARVLRNLNVDQFVHVRSGLHCDLHPRWKADGTAFCIDSRHTDDRRCLYRIPVDVS